MLTYFHYSLLPCAMRAPLAHCRDCHAMPLHASCFFPQLSTPCPLLTPPSLFLQVLGDLHIPHRTSLIPPKFKKMLVPNKMQHVLATGNLTTPDTLSMLRNLAPNVHCTRGDFDDASLALPETKVVQIGEFKIGLVHGHQVVPWGDPDSLAMKQRSLDCDVLISGHTHESSVVER